MFGTYLWLRLFNLVSFFFWLDPKEAKSQGPQKRQAILLANYHLSFLMAGEALSENFTFSPDNSEIEYFKFKKIISTH